jgi:hypothetical protein
MTDEIKELKEKFEKYLEEQDEKEELKYTLTEKVIIDVLFAGMVIFMIFAFIIAITTGSEIGTAVAYLAGIIFFSTCVLYKKLERNSQHIYEVYKLMEKKP